MVAHMEFRILATEDGKDPRKIVEHMRSHL
eukprot:COSAG02_NODE_61755_length_267_cov_1.541667_1_plen_29_part_10